MMNKFLYSIELEQCHVILQKSNPRLELKFGPKFSARSNVLYNHYLIFFNFKETRLHWFDQILRTKYNKRLPKQTATFCCVCRPRQFVLLLKLKLTDLNIYSLPLLTILWKIIHSHTECFTDLDKVNLLMMV